MSFGDRPALLKRRFGWWALPLGAAAGASIAFILWATMQIEAREGARAAELGGAAGFDPDDAILFVPLLIWLGYSQAMIVAAAIGAPAFALFMALKFRAQPGE